MKACVVALVWSGIDARPPVNRAKGAFGLEEVISGELSSVGFSGTWISGECTNPLDNGCHWTPYVYLGVMDIQIF
jgi:hypothetical protein